MSGYTHWLCFDGSTYNAGCGIIEAGVLTSQSIEAVTCLGCRYEFRLRVARDRDPRWSTNGRLHTETQELREKLATLQGEIDTLTQEKVEWLSGRLMQAIVKNSVETEFAQPDPECAGCKRWTQRIKVLEERVEYARKVLEGR